MSVLRNVVLVDFDPRNKDHVSCIQSTLETGKLDPRFRFHYDEPFSSAMTQAHHLMVKAYMKDILGTKENLKIEEINQPVPSGSNSVRVFPTLVHEHWVRRNKSEDSKTY